jgi:hypothetical protein
MNRMSLTCFASAFVAKPARATYVMHFAASGEQALELLAGEIEPQLIVILSEIKSTCPAWMGCSRSSSGSPIYPS